MFCVERSRRIGRTFLGALPGAPDRLIVAVGVTGVVGGLIGAAYVAALTQLRRVLWPSHWSRGAHWLLLIGVGAVIAVLLRLLGDAGDTELLVDNIHVSGGADRLGPLRSLVPVSLLGIAVGGGIGPEAPLTQTTGTIGSFTGTRFGLTAEQRRICSITGMAAGFTVLFAAPLGGAVFALEILHRKGLEYYEALVPAAIGSVAGYGVYTAATGWGLQPIWRFPTPPLHLTMADLGWAAVCGVAGALVAAIFTATTLLARAAFRPLPPWARPVVAGALLGAVAFISPFGLTFAEFQLGGFARLPHVAVATLLLAVLGHLLSATITMAGGWKGGFIIPLFFMGYCLGRAASGWLPGADELVLATAMMVACNVGVTKTPLGSTLVVAGMAGMRLLPTMLIAALVSLLLTSGVGLLESQRSRGRDATAPRLAGGPGLEGAPA